MAFAQTSCTKVDATLGVEKLDRLDNTFVSIDILYLGKSTDNCVEKVKVLYSGKIMEVKLLKCTLVKIFFPIFICNLLI